MSESEDKPPLVALQGPAGWIGLGVLTLFLLSPLLLDLAVNREAGERFDTSSLWNLGMSALWLLTLHLWFRRTWLLHILLLPLYLLAVADSFLVLNFDSRLTSSYISIALTDAGETSDFLSVFLPEAIMAGIAIGVVYPLGVYLVRKVRVHAPWPLKALTIGLLIVGYGVVAARQARTHNLSLADACLDVLARDLSCPMGVPAQFAVAVSLLDATNQNIDARWSHSLNARRTWQAKDEVYVIVVGESARPDHLSINGYERQTTPELAKIEGLVSFREMITTAPHTSLAVPSMLSLAAIDNWQAVESQRSIISAFRQVGFETYWFSLQDIDQWAGITHHVAAEAETWRFYGRKKDGLLIDEVRKVLHDPKPRKILFVLHTKGSHFEFSRRYPPKFRKFAEGGSSRRQHLVNTYDNSILYTDYVLAGLIDVLKARNTHAMLFFASDHGENLRDDERNLFGHAMGNEFDLPIAAFLWMSDKLILSKRAQYERARACVERKLSLGCLPHSMLDLLGVDADGLDRSRSIFHPDLADHERRYRVRGKLYAERAGKRIEIGK